MSEVHIFLHSGMILQLSECQHGENPLFLFRTAESQRQESEESGICETQDDVQSLVSFAEDPPKQPVSTGNMSSYGKKNQRQYAVSLWL